MPTVTNDAAVKKAAYQRPYKTRSQRREEARRKMDDNNDRRFLLRIVVVGGLLLLLVAAFAIKGFSDRQVNEPIVAEELR